MKQVLKLTGYLYLEREYPALSQATLSESILKLKLL